MPRLKKSHREAAYYRKQAADHMRAARRENSEEKRIQLENVAKGFQILATNEQWLAGDVCPMSESDDGRSERPAHKASN
jgi:hypothetical protein